MVITQDMPVSGIVNSWDHTKAIFQKYAIPADSNKALQDHLSRNQLEQLIYELNKIIGSSEKTCIEGGGIIRQALEVFISKQE